MHDVSCTEGVPRPYQVRGGSHNDRRKRQSPRTAGASACAKGMRLPSGRIVDFEIAKYAILRGGCFYRLFSLFTGWTRSKQDQL